MISIDISVVYQVIFFLVLWLVLSRVLFRPYLGLLEEREKNTTGARQAAAELEGESARLRTEYEQKILEAEARGRAMKEEILNEARQQSEQLVNQARQEAAALLERARAEIQRQMDNEREIVATEADRLARDMVNKILGRNVA